MQKIKRKEFLFAILIIAVTEIIALHFFQEYLYLNCSSSDSNSNALSSVDLLRHKPKFGIDYTYNISNRRAYLVLLWGPWNNLLALDILFANLSEYDPRTNLTISFTSNRKLLSEVDAVIFHISNLAQEFRFNKSFPTQKGFLLSLEPPENYDLPSAFKNKTDNNIEYIISYRKDADVYLPYGETNALSFGFSFRNYHPNLFPNIFDTKSKDAAWIVSNCRSNQVNFVSTLQEYITIEIFGTCPGHFPLSTDINVMKNHLSKYRFYFALENSRCKDYITDKFFKIAVNLAAAIPVVNGGLSRKDYEDIFPGPFIHTDDFNSIKELGEYIQHVSQNKTLYNSYFAGWKAKYDIHYHPWDIATRIAPILAYDLKPKHKSLPDYWNDPKQCRSSIAHYS